MNPLVPLLCVSCAINFFPSPCQMDFVAYVGQQTIYFIYSGKNTIFFTFLAPPPPSQSNGPSPNFKPYSLIASARVNDTAKQLISDSRPQPFTLQWRSKQDLKLTYDLHTATCSCCSPSLYTVPLVYYYC